MFIPASFGTLRFVRGSCFLEHRNTSNHLMRTRLVRSLQDNSVGSSAEAAAFLADELGLEEGSTVFVEGFLVGDGPEFDLAVRNATTPPTHRGTLRYSGSRSLLVKSTGTRLLRRLGSTARATQMLTACGKTDGEPIVVGGMEAISPSSVPIIEIVSVEGC